MDSALSKAGHSVDPVAAERTVTSWTEQMSALRQLIANASLGLPTYDAEKAQKVRHALLIHSSDDHGGALPSLLVAELCFRSSVLRGSPRQAVAPAQIPLF